MRQGNTAASTENRIVPRDIKYQGATGPENRFTSGGTRRHGAAGPGKLCRLSPLAYALSLLLLSCSARAAGPRPFSGDWFAAKGAAQSAGLPSGGGAGVSPVMTLAQQQQVNPQLQRSLASFNRAAAAIAAQQAAQAAAHQTALNTLSTLPDGLTAGGLVVDPRVGSDANLWVNASQPGQSQSGNQTTVTLNQTAKNAVLTWQSFNVGKNTTVDFNQQGNADWVALNRIDASGVPSQIQGQIKADGTVLLINPNGIIFTGTSQVNVHSLIAAAMDINGYSGNNVGVFNTTGAYNPVTVGGVVQTLNGQTLLAPANEDSANQTFITSGLYINNTVNVAGTAGQVFFSAPSTAMVGGNAGVQVRAGAHIAAAVSGTDNGGLVALLGPMTANDGSISAPAGQVILAAGGNLGLSEPPSGGINLAVVPAPEIATSSTLAWSSADSLGSLGGLSANQAGGLLSATRGNVTLFGDTVEQLGDIDVTTSITRTGSVDLRAVGGTVGATAPGSYLDGVVFGADSVTAIVPDENGESMPTNSASSFTPPSIAVQNAANVDVQSGALVEAPGVSFTISGMYAPPFSGSASPTGRVLLETGSTINLAGTEATVPQSAYLYTFKVTANDVADSPLAQNLIGQTVTVNLLMSGTRADGENWVGSPLFASSGAGYLGDVPQSIDQLLSRGGVFTVAKGNGLATFADVIQASGSLLDVSGGMIELTGATLNTTRLLAADGALYDIGDADPDTRYAGPAGTFTVNHARWGVSESYKNPLLTLGYYNPGYLDGVSAGGVNITAVNPVLEGTLDGDMVTGSRQRALAVTATGAGGAQMTPDQLPQGAALNLTLAGGPTADEVVLAASAPEQLPAGFDFLSSDFLNGNGILNAGLPGTLPVDAYGLPVIVYSTDRLSAEGLGAISIKGASLLSMQSGATLQVLSGGSITLGNATTIDGALTARGGTISIGGFQPTATTTNGNPTAYVFPAAYDNLVLGPDARLDVSGRWVNDTGADAASLLGKAYTHGGSVSLTTYALSHPVSTTSANGITIVDAADGTASIVLDSGSLIDVSGGGYVGINGQLAMGSNGLPAGTGGNLALTTYAYTAGWISNTMADNLYDQGNNQYAPAAADAATVVMDGTVRAGGFAGGGTFTLQAPAIVIGGSVHPAARPSADPSANTSIPAGADPSTNIAVTASADPSAGSAVPVSADPSTGTVTLPAKFFQGGFSSYNLTSTYGSVTVTPGTTVRLEQQTYRLNSAGLLPATGAAPDSFATLGFAPDGERPAAGLSVTELPFAFGQSGDASATAGIVLGQGASLITDPGAAVSFISGRSIDIFGTITDHGGAVTLAGAQDSWIGAGASIDVSGTLVPDPTVTDYATGSELAGGSITFGLSQFSNRIGYSGNGAVLVQDGALLDIRGGQAVTQTPVSAGGILALGAQLLWSDGGSLVFNGGSGLLLGGTIEAGGGAPGAAGGSIAIGNISGSSQAANNFIDNNYASIVLTQSMSPAASLAGAAAPARASDLSALLAQSPAAGGAAYVTADMLSRSGFSTAVLNGGQINAAGPLTLSGLGELDLAGPVVLPATGGAVVNLDADYIRLLGYAQTVPTLGDGTLNLNAGAQIDIEGAVSVSGAANVNLSSGGDIRLIWADGSLLSAPLVSFPIQTDGSTAAAPALAATSLNVPDNLTLTARETYVATGTRGVLRSLGLGTDNTLTLASNGAMPYTPLSAGGSLLADAPTIVQDGALYAPLGAIQLGVSASEPVPASLALTGATPLTRSVTLGAGSLTSVSIAGQDIPYGNTINGTWQQTSLPEKQVVLAGADISTQADAVLDLSGGGDVYATEFVAGTGGSRNVLTTASQTVYALVPGYGSDVAAPFPTAGYDLASWNAGGSDAAAAFSLQPGLTVTLPGGAGLPAGTYTLMPAMYATLPGAYRVVVVSANANPNATVSGAASGNRPSFTGPDGTVYTTGVLGNTVTGGKSSQLAELAIQSQAVWSKYSEIDLSSANNAFTATAQSNGQVTPRLPIDAGHLILAATGALDFNASDNFAIGTAIDAAGNTLSGRGGLADVTGGDLLVVAADEAAAYAANPDYQGATLLDADQLSRLGVASLLVGGVRTSTATGVSIAPAAVSLTVATDAAHPLTAPDLMQATTGAITHTTATTPVNAAAGAQTVTIATGLSGIAAGQGIVLYDASSAAGALNWVQGTVTSYDPVTGSLTIAGASAGGSGQIGHATVLIATPGLGTGLTVAGGSVIQAVGTVPTGTSQAIAIGAAPVVTATNASTGAVTGYTPGVSGDGALLRVSNGDDVAVSRAFVPGLYNASTQPAARCRRSPAPPSAAPWRSPAAR